MKNLFYILVAGLLLLNTSCDDYLDSGASSSKSDEELYSDPNLTEGAVMGIYNLMTENRSYRNRMICYMGVNTDIETHSNSKDAAGKTDRTALATYQQTSSMTDGFNDSNSSDPWSRMYAIVEQANLVIKGIQDFGNPTKENQMGTLLAEALTLRAMVYNDLIKYWGDVPARFEPVSADNVYMKKSDRNSIYNRILDDLKTAEEFLPYSKTQYSNTQRVSTTFIKGLRARIALMAAGYQMKVSEDYQTINTHYRVDAARRTELYTIARDECKDIIAQDPRTLGNYEDVFKRICERNFASGSEIIFQMPFSSSRGEYVSYLGLRREYEKLSGDKYSSITVKGEISVVPSFFYDLQTGDTRRDVTAAPYKWVDDVQTLTSVNKFYLAKFRAEWMKDNFLSSNDDGIAHCVLRYADILLMAAEAINELESAPTTEAIGYLEAIRKRAFSDNEAHMNYCGDYTTKEGFLNAIVNERAFEFCGENIRKWDLMRWGALKSKMDEAKANLSDLREQSGAYSGVPADVYYKLNADNQTLEIWGLNRGEDTPRNTDEDKAEGWKKKSWLTATDSSTGKLLLDEDAYVNKALYQCEDPDERQLLPIMDVVISNSQGALSNYGYLSAY